MVMKKTLLIVASFFWGLALMAQIPEGYYSSAEGKYGDELKAALHNIIKDHKTYSYNALRDYLLRESDEDPSNSNNVILIYSGKSIPKDDFNAGGDGWNREHVWAKSHGDFGTSRPAGTDAHHIRPCDVTVNSSRGNKEFDNGGTPHHEAIGCFSDSDSWEPRDEVKGDVARMIMYMAVRYEGENGEPDLEMNDQVDNGSAPFHGKQSTLMEWHKMDPPSDFEKHRNEVVFSYQENRNPFIDHPEYVDMIWNPDVAVKDIKGVVDPKIYMNQGSLIVDLSGIDKQDIAAKLYDINGKLIEVIDCKESQRNNISLSQYTNGLYILRLRVGDAFYAHKLML